MNHANYIISSLQWRHNEHDCVLNHQPYWIPRTKGQWRGKNFHSMTSYCLTNSVCVNCISVPPPPPPPESLFIPFSNARCFYWYKTCLGVCFRYRPTADLVRHNWTGPVRPTIFDETPVSYRRGEFFFQNSGTNLGYHSWIDSSGVMIIVCYIWCRWVYKYISWNDGMKNLNKQTNNDSGSEPCSCYVKKSPDQWQINKACHN